MADNTTLPGTGEIIATDDISGVKYQRVKPAFGADGTATDVSASNPMPVVQTGTPTLATGAATAAAQATGNTSLGSIDTKLSGALTAVGQTALSASTLTRPADTTAYTAQDTIANATSAAVVITFANAARVSGGSGTLTKARLVTDQATNTARFRLHLYAIAPTALQDNAAFLTDWANRNKSIGSIDFGAASQEATGGTAAGATNKTDRLAFVCPSGATSIFGILETLDGFTPASAQNFYIELTIEQN